MLSIAGTSLLQGRHQLAQKFSTTGCPRSSARVNCPPSRRSSVKSGAAESSLGLGGGPDCWEDSSGTRDICVHNAPRIKIEIISIIRRLETEEDMFVLCFILCI